MGDCKLKEKKLNQNSAPESNFTSFFPKSPPGFMVAKIWKCFPAVKSSTSLPLSPGLPFSANTKDFSTSRTLKEKLGKKLEKAYVLYAVDANKTKSSVELTV